MATAYAAVANGGVWKQPHLVLSSRVKQRRVISRAVSEQLMAMMRDVVLEGTGTEAAVEGYQVAGKTGTAASRTRAAATRPPATSPRSSARCPQVTRGS